MKVQTEKILSIFCVHPKCYKNVGSLEYSGGKVTVPSLRDAARAGQTKLAI